jgi:predicted nucleic acid-binding Zn ribbon protein
LWRLVQKVSARNDKVENDDRARSKLSGIDQNVRNPVYVSPGPDYNDGNLLQFNLLNGGNKQKASPVFCHRQ